MPRVATWGNLPPGIRQQLGREDALPGNQHRRAARQHGSERLLSDQLIPRML